MTSTTAAAAEEETTKATMMPDVSESETNNSEDHYENDIDVDDMIDERQKQKEERQQRKEERRQRKQVRRQLKEERKRSEQSSSTKLSDNGTGMEDKEDKTTHTTNQTKSKRQVVDEPPSVGSKNDSERRSKRQIVQHANYGVGFDDATGLVIGDMVMDNTEGSTSSYRMNSADYRDASKSELREVTMGEARQGSSRRSNLRQNNGNSITSIRSSESANNANASRRSWIHSTSGRLLGDPDESQSHSHSQKHPDDSITESIRISSHNFEMDETDDDRESQRELFYDEDNNVDENGNKNLKDMSGMAMFILFVVGLTVGITCQVHGCTAKGSNNPPPTPPPIDIFNTPRPTPTTPAPSTPPPTEPPTQLMEGLSPVTLEAFRNPISPQSKALQWLKEDPFLGQYSNKRRLQRFALATLYYATNGPTTWVDNTNWLRYGRDHQECTWFSQKDNRVYPEYETEYNLYPCSPTFDYIFLTPWNNGMSGSIPPELGLLTKLQVLDLTQGSIRGTLPTELGLLTDLKKVWLAALQLTGTLPPAFFTAWSNLEGIGLYSNKLSGSIPTEIGLATRLEILEGYDNDFSGPIPSEFGLLGRLSDVQIDNNKLSAAIPTELGLATALSAFMAWENQLTGSVPSQLGQLSNLTRLLLSGNSLTSTLPVELMQGLGNLQGLLMARNQLDGSVDDYNFASDGLVLLHLEGNNDLVGTFPQTLCALESGLQFNCNPATLCGCTCECSNNRTAAVNNNNNGGGGGGGSGGR